VSTNVEGQLKAVFVVFICPASDEAACTSHAGRGGVGWERVGMAFPHLFALETLLEGLDFSF